MWLVLWCLSQVLSYTTAAPVNGSTITAVIAAQSMGGGGGGGGGRSSLLQSGHYT